MVKQTNKKQRTTKKTAEQVATELHDYLVKLFIDTGVSGILHIPFLGTVTMCSDEASRLRLLEHAKLELNLDDIVRQKKAELWAMKRNRELRDSTIEKQEKPSYVG